MTIHIFREDNITPTTRSIDVRNVLDASGPHRVSFGCRCTVVGPGADYVIMSVIYETDNGQTRTIGLPAPIDLTTTSSSLGGMWYAPEELVIDFRHPLGDGALVSPYGQFNINFLNGGNVNGAKISYEAIIEQFDGSATVVHHP